MPHPIPGAPADPLDGLLQSLYASIAQDAPWEGFLRLLAGATDATYATLLLGRERGVPDTIVSPDANPQAADDYADAMFARDPFVGLPEGEVIAFADFVDPATMSADFRRYLEHSDSQNILGLDLRDESGTEARVRLTRDSSLPGFDQAEREVLQRLVPHLRIALALFDRLRASAAAEGVYRGAIEQLALGTIILDRQGRIQRSNAVADRLLAARDGIADERGTLRLTHRGAAAELRRLLAAPPAIGEAATLRIPRSGAAAEFGAVVRAVVSPDRLAAGGTTLALFINNPEDAAKASPEVLRDLFQLTRAEALLAAALANGQALPEAARALGIAHNTARAQLRLIFAKTGAHRQSQLVHLLRSSVAGLGGVGRS
jgi:DNA-binding CsgD family transcriptional regulator/PAS domain-containing protein